MSAAPNLHGTALVVSGHGLLIRGASGSGKSSLALSTLRRAQALGLPARLVSDDQIFVTPDGARLRMRAPEAIRGLLEVRGVGLLRQPFVIEAPAWLVVDLCPRETIRRLPEPSTAEIAGVTIRRITLPERDPAFGADVLVSLVEAEGSRPGPAG